MFIKLILISFLEKITYKKKKSFHSASEELQFDAKLDKSEPDFRVLTVIHVCYQIVQLMQLYFQNAIVPLISSIPNFHRELAMQKTVFFVNFENKINAILQKYCDGELPFQIMQ